MPTGSPSAVMPAGTLPAGRLTKRDQERRRDPIDVVLEFLAVDLGREIHLHREGLHRRRRREQHVEALEQLAEAMEHFEALLLGRGDVEGGHLQAGLDVAIAGLVRTRSSSLRLAYCWPTIQAPRQA